MTGTITEGTDGAEGAEHAHAPREAGIADGAAEGGARTVSASAAAPPRVLVIASRETGAMSLLSMLRDAGAAPRHVAGEAAGLRALAHASDDVCVIDGAGCAREGLAILEAAAEGGCALPILFLAPRSDPRLERGALAAGAAEVLVGAPDAPSLARALGQARARGERLVAVRAAERQAAGRRHRIVAEDRAVAVQLLASSAAHEISNPLATVVANLDVLTHELQRMPAGSVPADLGEALADARVAATDLRQRVRDLKRWGTPGDRGASGAANVEQLCDAMLDMLADELRARAQLSRRYGGVPPVAASATRLGRVLLHLLDNALHALPAGDPTQHTIEVSTEVSDGDVKLTLRDTGVGIPPEVLARLAGPFSPARAAACGTGLGLPVSQRIIAELGGSFTIGGAPGRGTIVTLRLPVADPTAPGHASLPRHAAGRVAQPGARRGRVLIIDDDHLIASAVRRTLAPRHDVHAAPGARAALVRIAAGERFDAILCDLAMPEITGRALHAALSALSPAQARVLLFMCDGTSGAAERAFLDAQGVRRIDKPLDPLALRAVVDALVEDDKG